MSKMVFLGWVVGHEDQALLANKLGARPYFIAYGPRKGYLLPLRYFVQAVRTWWLLRRERPDVIITMIPPTFLALEAWLYTRLHGGRTVIESHSANYVPPWSWLLWLHRFLSRRAVATLVTNEHLRRIVAGWNCRALIIGFMVVDYPPGETVSLDGPFNVVATCSYNADEPTAAIVEAARLVPDVTFHLTGRLERVPRELLKNKPENCHFTGFLPHGQFVGLLRAADAVMDLTTRNHTVLMGAFEAIALSKPLVTSDWPVLYEAYPKGTAHVDNTPQGIAAGVRYVRDHYATLQREIIDLRRELQAQWEQQVAALQSLLDTSNGDPNTS